jgi:hypothetical protein
MVPIGVAAIWLAGGALQRASSVSVCFFCALGALLFYISWAIWARFIPSAVSFFLGAAIWIAGFWIAWRGHMWF